MDLVKPIPRPSSTTRPFWDGLNERKVQIQRCDACDSWVFYPRTRCPSCLGNQLVWHEVSGRGVLYTYTLARQPTAPHFADETPQQLAVVELDEGVRMTSTLVNVDPSDIVIGMRLRPYFDQVSDAITLLRYQPG
ncbi:MAG: Zn-ribbon domain-containing OB-fold protein [Pseudomonadota bacterium]|nr:Zn-ribbon domain-containing OB-fold protein [Pseudomonadota bacterium]MEC8868228.1 Zn-ribbon domain-containing OB-fold protein [Pseudomonadota bacterium]MEC9285047.1 Zn-ribbon domain-containing OB-fold protein [Pseudomonadota bacterium]MEE3182514.1 Zn-ribbon domain-containing OB-fold protein [Pseudomonadota bacterium]